MLKDRFRGFLPVVIDIETAGTNPATDAILEIAAITLKMNDAGILEINSALHFNVTPFKGANIDSKALEITKIDINDPHRNAIIEKEALEKIFKMIRQEIKKQSCTRGVLVAHNAHFDQSFLKNAITRNNLKRDPFHPFTVLDTASIANFMLGQSVLASACIKAGIEFDGHKAHSALYDATKTAELFCTLVNNLKDLTNQNL